MNLQLPASLEARLARLAAESGQSVEQLAIELLASSLEHDAWFRREVEQGQRSVREARLIEHADIVSRFGRP